jgi:hypothetical protein
MSRSFSYTVSGTARAVDQRQTWTVEGTITLPPDAVFSELIDPIIRAAFLSLTHGKAVYGKPGIGCHGPYLITKLALEEDQA